MNKAIKKLWLRALRSGKYRQAIQALKSKRGGYCCLGVLCELHRLSTPKSRRRKWVHVRGHNEIQYMRRGDELPLAVRRWAGLGDGNGNPRVIVNGEDRSLAFMNDALRARFPAIAKAIEQSL